MGDDSEQADGTVSRLTAIGSLDNVCPSCDSPLTSRPSRKSKCPRCGTFIHVRKRPLDGLSVLVTEQEAEELDSQWDMMRPSLPPSASALAAFEREIAAFAAKLNRDPSDPDLRWLFLSQQFLRLAQAGDWGLSRNVRMDMAAILQKEGRLQDALRTFLEVCYMDLNGPTNMGGLADPDSPEEFPGFSLELGSLAPAIVDQAFNLTKQLQLSEADVQREFIAIASRIYKNVRVPLSPEEAWTRLRPELVDDD